ncbi:hypothetical protein NDU88_008273 [Pleurodeles waltl]|uniref:Uncharacterized protein n=1 Tax=Pleurodeles waltl TaxID=8319 RepID=A0AAV7NVH7_PLEWA|nr:hypothetical protein NDU88_008273 [Pleurodeles waltl]
MPEQLPPLRSSLSSQAGGLPPPPHAPDPSGLLPLISEVLLGLSLPLPLLCTNFLCEITSRASKLRPTFAHQKPLPPTKYPLRNSPTNATSTPLTLQPPLENPIALTNTARKAVLRTYPGLRKKLRSEPTWGFAKWRLGLKMAPSKYLPP